MTSLDATPAMRADMTAGGTIRASLSGPETMNAVIASGGTGGTRDYERLYNHPTIEDVELVGNRTLDEFGMGVADAYDIHQLFR